MLRIAIVGAGGMGTVHHSNYAHVENCRVQALVGVSAQDARRAEEWKLPLYPSIEALLAAEDIDVVDICTPTFLHKQQALEALGAGKHVIVEKPIALHRKDAEEMYACAKANAALLFVAQALQFTKEISLLHALVTSGEFGKPLDAFFQRLTACPYWAQGGWLFDKEKSGLLPFDLHIHDLDIIVRLFGTPKSMSFTSCGNSGRDYKEHYRFDYRFEGLQVVAEAGWLNANIPFSAGWRVYFEKALVIYDGERVTAYPAEGEPIVYDTADDVLIPTGINVPPTGMYLRELRHFLGCIEKGSWSQLVPEAQVLEVVGILESILAEDV